MNRIICNDYLTRSSKFFHTFNRTFSTQQINSMQNSLNSRSAESNNQLNKLQVSTRNISSSSISFLKEKPKYDENKKDDILIGEIKPEENRLKVLSIFLL